MPFTPFHFGPALVVKGAVPRHFSWVVFVATQVVIDLETLYFLVKRAYPVHRTLHTLAGATAAGIVTASLFLGLRWYAQNLSSVVPSGWAESSLLQGEASTAGILFGGIVGGFSHPILDALMHADVMPFAPWSTVNPLLNSVGLVTLHGGCLLSGLLGVVIIWFQARRKVAAG